MPEMLDSYVNVLQIVCILAIR